MNKDSVDVYHNSRSFRTFGFSRQIKQATTFFEILLLLAYALAMVLSLPLLFI